MVCHAPLRLIAGRYDGKINSPVDQADASAARAAGTFCDDIQQLSCDDGACFSRTAARQDLLFTIDIGFDGAPFRCNLSGDRFGFHSEYRRCQADCSPPWRLCVLLAADRRRTRLLLLRQTEQGHPICSNAGDIAAAAAIMQAPMKAQWQGTRIFRDPGFERPVHIANDTASFRIFRR